MPSTKNYRQLHDRVLARPGAADRLHALRDDTLAEIGLDALRRKLERSQADIAAELGISQPAVSQLEHSDDPRLSTLRTYVSGLGARLGVFAIFEDGEDITAIPLKIGGDRMGSPRGCSD
ncbi:helix-turn-helix domain-containing protein [Candidatus Poriferisodalis sp.]|uniref:helix-turn-helix domain-containing protein n=1 Tax=Candidatus Poriferisodalis sp. TaxID=3101277 RepID=UPI003B021290